MIGYIIIGIAAGFVASKIYKKEGSGCFGPKGDCPWRADAAA